MTTSDNGQSVKPPLPTLTECFKAIENHGTENMSAAFARSWIIARLDQWGELRALLHDAYLHSRLPDTWYARVHTLLGDAT